MSASQGCGPGCQWVCARTHSAGPVHSTNDAVEYSHTKCTERAADFAIRFQLACVRAASNTASKAASGIQTSYNRCRLREERVMLRVYGDVHSGNCFKVKLVLHQLDIAHEWTHVDILK